MTSEVARVFVNEVEVGALPAEQYRQIVKDVRRDKRLILAQSLNYGHVAYMFFAKTVLRWPVTLLACVALLEVSTPATVVDMITMIRAATPTEANGAMGLILGWSWVVSCLFEAGCRLVWNRHSGLIDCFDESVNFRIRSLLQEPVEGRLSVVIGGAACDDK